MNAPRIALLIGLVVVSLAVASTLHLSGRSNAAGIAEAVIGVVLAGAAVRLWQAGSPARHAGLWATGFAIAGFCLGLSITARGGHWPDIAYHITVLLILVTIFGLLLRLPRPRRS